MLTIIVEIIFSTNEVLMSSSFIYGEFHSVAIFIIPFYTTHNAKPFYTTHIIAINAVSRFMNISFLQTTLFVLFLLGINSLITLRLLPA